MKKVVYETYGSSQQYFYEFTDHKSEYVQQSEDKGQFKKGIFNRVKETFKSGFLPQGYPDSVSEDYLQYQVWDTVQAFCSTITGMLATQAVLKGYGVGDEAATITAASITWMLKDGTGMVGRIMFAWWKGTHLDSDPKRWRLCADVLNDIAIFLDLLAPIFKSYFIFIACISSVTRSIVGVCGGATRAALTLHQARRNNISDVSAKDGSQETLVGLLALITSVIITPFVAERTMLVWFLFFLFTFLHLYANYKGVSCVIMETINMNRLFILLTHYLQHDQVLTTSQACKLDPVIRNVGIRKNINVGTKLQKVLRCYNSPQEILQNTFDKKQDYVLGFDTKNINIALQKNADNGDLMRACIQALLLDILFNEYEMKKITGKYKNELTRVSTNLVEGKMDLEVISHVKKFCANFSDGFIENLKEKKWDLSKSHLNPDEWRYDWHTKIE